MKFLENDPLLKPVKSAQNSTENLITGKGSKIISKRGTKRGLGVHFLSHCFYVDLAKTR